MFGLFWYLIPWPGLQMTGRQDHVNFINSNYYTERHVHVVLSMNQCMGKMDICQWCTTITFFGKNSFTNRTTFKYFEELSTCSFKNVQIYTCIVSSWFYIKYRKQSICFVHVKGKVNKTNQTGTKPDNLLHWAVNEQMSILTAAVE